MSSDEAWNVLQAQLATDDAAHDARVRERRSRRSRKPVEAEAGDEFAPSPDLCFVFPEVPPKHTLQAGRGVQVTRNGKVRFFTRKRAREEATALVWKFKSALPAGWKPRGEAVRLEIMLVYGARRADRLTGDGMVFHTERPDADNLTKSILDSMTKAEVWLDDAQVCDLSVRKRRSALPRWECRVWFARTAQKQFDF